MLLSADGSINNFAPQVLAERHPVITNGHFYADNGIQLLGTFQEYAALYRSQPSVATVVDKVAASAARLNLKVWKDTPKDGGKSEQPTSDLAALLANPSRTLNPYSFYRWTVSTIEIMGEAYWIKLRDKTGKVIALEPMHPQMVTIVRSERGHITYKMTPGPASVGILEIDQDDVVPFRRYNPDNTMRGLSRLEQLRVTLLNEDAARRASSAFWKNGARPSVILSHPMELSQAASDRIRAQFDARHSGADNTGSSVVLEEGMTVSPNMLTNEEMQYIDSRKLNMQEVCMVFDVPPPVVHILDHATYSNITEQMRSMYRDTMAPRLEEIESTLDHHLLTDFWPDGGYHVEFDMTEILRGDFETRVDKAVALRNAGLTTGNEGREIIGLMKSDDPNMDLVLANGALTPINAPDPAAAAPVPGSGEDHRVPGDELIDGGPTPAGAPGTVEGDDLLAKPETVKAVRSLNGVVGRKVNDGAGVTDALVDTNVKALTDYFNEQREALRQALPKA